MALAPGLLPTVVVVAKPPVAGCVKTRLIGPLDPRQAARVHGAMLSCVLRRAAVWIGRPAGGRLVLALDRAIEVGRRPWLPPVRAAGRPGPAMAGAPRRGRWLLIEQGGGDLGRRMARVWRRVGGGPVLFLGADSPDAPAAVLQSVLPALAGADVAVGPVPDGGYWVLAARRFEPRLLAGIDWGTPAVYDQTRRAGRRCGLTLAELAGWFDVDHFGDLCALRGRLGAAASDHGPDPALRDLRAALERLFKELRP